MKSNHLKMSTNTKNSRGAFQLINLELEFIQKLSYFVASHFCRTRQNNDKSSILPNNIVIYDKNNIFILMAPIWARYRC